MKLRALVLVVLCGCGGEGEAPVDAKTAATSAGGERQLILPSATVTAAGAFTVEAPKPAPLSVKWLGVQGFMLRVGDDAVLTAPLYTRPSWFTVSAGLPVRSDDKLVEAQLPTSELKDVRAVISGHAHYDHLLDVPSVLQRAPGAKLFGNVSARNLLAAWAPDRSPSCAGTAGESPQIARSRVIALDDVSASKVDWTNCLSEKPAGVPTEGTWVSAGGNVRVLAVCSMHPAQVGPYHFGEGHVLTEACSAPTKMPDWKEGITLAFLIDFLDPATGAPRYRVYYQDAPAQAPLSHVPASYLAEKRVDLALLNVGSYDSVQGEPTATINNLNPRFAIGGHWEDFFRDASEPTQPIMMLNPTEWKSKALAAMPADGTDSWKVNGAARVDRVVVPNPGDAFVVAP